MTMRLASFVQSWAICLWWALNLGPIHPELLIDARLNPASLTHAVSELKKPLTAQIYVRPVMIKRFVDGLLEARYAIRWGHVFMLSGPTRIGIKFVDAIGPFGPVHLNSHVITQVKGDVEKWDYGLVKKALSPSEIARLRKRLLDQAKGDKEAGVGFFDGGETNLNQRVWCLPNKGQEFIDLLKTNKTIDDFVPDFLGDDAILFSYTANIARPGNTPMYLHTDQLTIQPPIRQVVNLIMYFFEDLAEINGGTLVMPGSHKGNYAPDDPYDTSDTIAASGPAGTCMLFESRLWHATGANKQPGSETPVIIVFFMTSCMRQQENFQLSFMDEVVEKFCDKVKGYLDWRTTGSLGGVQGNLFKDGTIARKPNAGEFIGVFGGHSVRFNQEQ